MKNEIGVENGVGKGQAIEQQQPPNLTKDLAVKKRKWFVVVHVLAVVVSCGLSAGIGYATYATQRARQVATFQTQFDRTVLLMENSIRIGFTQKFAVARLLQKLYSVSTARGYGESYGQKPPFFTLPGFADLFSELATLGGNLRSMSWSPLVDTTNSSTRPAWEAWAKKNLLPQTYGLPGNRSAFNIMNTTAYKYGIYNKTSATTKARAGNVIPGADPRFAKWLVPVWQVAPLSNFATSEFFESHQFVGTRMKTIEKILAAGSSGIGGAFTDIVQLAPDINYRPSNLYYAPVYSKSPNPSVIGLVIVVLSWDLLISGALPNNLQRIDCVIATKSTTFTLSNDHGIVNIVGQGDHHELSMTTYGQDIEIDLTHESPLSASDFSITVYPSSAFYNEFITEQASYLGIALAVAVFVFLSMVQVSLAYYIKQQEKVREEKKRWDKSQEEKHRALDDAQKAEMDRKREMQLRLELQENIANSAHDMKSPACALSLAVGSLISTFYGKTHIDEDGCKMTMETLKGMMHTLSSLNTIINRSVDAASKISGNALKSNMDSIDIRTLLGDIMVYMRWQAENSSLTVTMEPYPQHLPTNICADLKWLREDLLCVASNALKFSQKRSKVPIVVRVTIDANDDETMVPLLRFTFIDSGSTLSKDRYSTLFDYPEMRSSERKGMGGMGLGLYCLRQRVTAMGGQCGARSRCDDLEGTEVWFCIPLLDADTTMKSFEHPHHIEPTLQAPLLVQQEVAVINKDDAAAVEASSRKKSDATTFVTAVGGTHRSTSTFTNDLSSNSDPMNQDSFDRTNNNNTASSNHDTSNALVPNKSKPPTRVRKSSDASPLLTLKQSFDRISEEKGGVTLPILIVDDSIAILKMIRRSLLNEMPDLVIKEARDGHEGFDLVQEETNGFHIIITDIQMPNCDGFDFTYRVREFEDRNRLPRTMVIGMSANYQEKIFSESVRCGMDGFLNKPFELQSIMDVINHIQLHRDLTKRMESMNEESSLSQRPQERIWKQTSTAKSLLSQTSSSSIAIANMQPSSSQAVFDLTIHTDVGNVVNKKAIGNLSFLVEGSLPLKNVSMLVVDDSVPVLKMMCTSLQEHGALITQAKDGQEAIRQCESVISTGGQDFDMILMDIQMPTMNGLIATQLIRSMEKELRLKPKIIMGISAYYGNRLTRKAMEAGVDAFLPKPFNYERFKEAFNDVLQRRNNIAIQGIGTVNNSMVGTDSILGFKPSQQPMDEPSGSGTLPPLVSSEQRIFPDASAHAQKSSRATLFDSRGTTDLFGTANAMFFVSYRDSHWLGCCLWMWLYLLVLSGSTDISVSPRPDEQQATTGIAIVSFIINANRDPAYKEMREFFLFSLRKTGYNESIVFMVTGDELNDDDMAVLDRYHATTHYVDTIKHNNPIIQRYQGFLTKLTVWTLIQYDRVLFYDSDFIFNQNPISAITACGDVLLCAVAPFRPEVFNSGFMVLRPNITEYAEMMKLKSIADGSQWVEQDILNIYFKQSVLKLPNTYNMMQIYGNNRNASQLRSVVAVHGKLKYLREKYPEPQMIWNTFQSNYNYSMSHKRKKTKSLRRKTK